MNNQHVHVKRRKKNKEIKTVYYLVYVKRERGSISSLLLAIEFCLHSILSYSFISIAKTFAANVTKLFLIKEIHEPCPSPSI